MAVPLRSVRNKPDSHPLITRLCRYVSLTDAEIASLRAAFERRLSIIKKRDVLLEGYEAHNLHVVVSGFATRYKLLANGKRQVLSIILPGEIIGMPAAFFRPLRYSVTTLSAMTVDVIPLTNFLELCRRVPSLAIAMLFYCEYELASYADHIIDVGRRSPLERIAHFVLEMHWRLRAAGCAAERSFDMPLSQEVTGDLLGLSAPHVNRMLHQLKTEQLISVDHRRVTIEDRESLQLLAQFEPPSPLALSSAGQQMPNCC
jgi:CRP-like cAMP-binding protein